MFLTGLNTSVLRVIKILVLDSGCKFIGRFFATLWTKRGFSCRIVENPVAFIDHLTALAN